jgi:hypothetical protein
VSSVATLSGGGASRREESPPTVLPNGDFFGDYNNYMPMPLDDGIDDDEDRPMVVDEQGEHPLTNPMNISLTFAHRSAERFI